MSREYKPLTPFIAIIFFLFTNSLSAEPLVRQGTCKLVVASRQTLGDAQAYVRGMDEIDRAQIFRSSNGWYAISRATLRLEDADQIISMYKNGNHIPQDSYCSSGRRYVALLDWRTGRQLNPRPSQSSTNSPSGGSGRNLTGAVLGLFMGGFNSGSSSSSGSGYTYNENDTCRDRDTCFTPLYNSGSEYFIRCTKGQNRGREYSIYQMNGGKWSTNGWNSHHDTMRSAGNWMCSN